MNRVEAIRMTNEVISKLGRVECITMFNQVGGSVNKLMAVIVIKYSELSKFYFDDDCTVFCWQVIYKHILKQSIEMVAAELV
jgi:hypothetical protein